MTVTVLERPAVAEQGRVTPRDRWAAPAALVAIVYLALQTTVANLPANKIFVGHDTGFYNIFPHQLLRTSTGSWEVKTAFGFPNFQALLTLPYAMLIDALHAIGLGGPASGRVMYFVELLACGLGSFFLAFVVVRRALPTLRVALVAVSAFGAALFASYNILDAVLLLYPPSPFQVEVLMWPAVVAAALAGLWYRPTAAAGLVVGLLCVVASIGNPAHTILGFAFLTSLFVVDGATSHRWKLRFALAAVAMVVGATAYMWLPSVAALFLYKGGVTAPEAADPGALALSEKIIATRTTFSNLLRLDGLIWWPKTRNAALYDSIPMMLLISLPAFVAFLALRTRARVVAWFWLAAVIGLFMAKGVHAPLPISILWLQDRILLFAAFRATYDKFVLVLLIVLPPLFAVGCASLAASSRVMQRAAFAVVLGCVFAGAWPFFAGRIAEPYFLTTIPDDYQKVDALLGGDSRALSLPGAPGEIFITSWYKGANFENLLFRSRVVNGAVFKMRSISAAPLYDDADGVQAEELPRLVGALGLYGFDHILLHKDFLTSYRMAFDHQRYKVLGPLTSLESESFLDGDARLTKEYEGPNLVLYRLKPKYALGRAYAASAATLAIGYEDTMLSFADAGLTAAARDPLLLFLGNQTIPNGALNQSNVDATLRRAANTVAAPVTAETPALYREQIALPAKRFAALGPDYLHVRDPVAFVYAQPHGDWLMGERPQAQNLDGHFTVAAPERLSPSVVVRAERVPSEAAALWFGDDTGLAWPISSYGDEQIPDDQLDEGSPPPTVRTGFAEPVTRLSSGRLGVSYSISLHAGAQTPELAVAGSPLLVPLPLTADPHVTLVYSPGDTTIVAAWLRVVLQRSDGHTIYLDKELDATGRLDDWSARDSAQAALDEQFDETLRLHQTDPAWVAAQSFFNPEQAESYQVTALRLIYGKQPGIDMRSNPGSYGVVLRSLRIELSGPPWRSYVDRGVSSEFGSSSARAITNLPSAIAGSRGGALLVNAVVREETSAVREPLVGRSATFHMADGSTIVADVLRETSDGYVVKVDPRREQIITRSAVAQIAASGPPRWRNYAVTLPLANVDLARYPEVHVRFWEGTAGIHPDIAFRVQTPIGMRTVHVTAGADEDAELPSSWIHKSDFPGLDAPIDLNGLPISVNSDTGWREAVFDLREITFEHLGYTAVRPVDITVTLSMEAGQLGTESAYAFGLGDVVFTGQRREKLRRPDQEVLAVDRTPLRPVSAAPLAGTPDLWQLRYDDVRVSRGSHTVSTQLRAPWTVVSVSLLGPQPAQPPQPRVTLTHIDDELYAVHLDAPGPAWLSFAETYHSGWRLIEARSPSGRVPWLLSLKWLAEPLGNHVVGNAYDNAWFVEGAGPRDYVIDFAPQDWVRIGEALSLVSVVLALTFVGLTWRRS
jgi:hypothetical protein